MIATAAVIHGELEWGLYRILSDFLRFCGVSVYNYILTEETDLQRTYEFDAVFIDATNSSRSLSASQRQRVEQRFSRENSIWMGETDGNSAIPAVNWDLPKEEEDAARIRFFTAVIEALAQRELLQGEDQAVLNALAELFVQRDILKNRVVLQTFLNVRSLVRVVRQNSVDAYVALLKHEKRQEWESNPYYWYAQRYLERNINESCSFLDDDMLLATKKVVAQIEGRIQSSGGHSQYQARLYFTIAHLYECDFFHQRSCTDAYTRGDQLARGGAFEYYAAYRVGRCMEKQMGNWDSAVGHYMRALQCEPREYRAAYKVAVYYWKQKKDVETACEYFKRIDRILQNRYAQNVLQPREAEYLYKAWHFIRQLIEENGRGPVGGVTVRAAEERMRQILTKIRDEKRENPVFAQIFGQDGLIDSADKNQPRMDARLALAERVKAVCTL